MVTAIVFGLVPAWQSAGVNLSVTMGHAARGETRRNRAAIGSLLVIAEVAMSLVLLVGAGLFLRTLSNLHDVDLGFAPERLLIVDVNPMAAGYRDRAYASLCQRLLERLSAVPGVVSATFSENGVLTGRDLTPIACARSTSYRDKTGSRHAIRRGGTAVFQDHGHPADRRS